jgi:hypothetical protein
MDSHDLSRRTLLTQGGGMMALLLGSPWFAHARDAGASRPSASAARADGAYHRPHERGQREREEARRDRLAQENRRVATAQGEGQAKLLLEVPAQDEADVRGLLGPRVCQVSSVDAAPALV